MLRIFSSGGGVQSTAALVLSAQGKIDYPTHIFANVGDLAESPHTIAYVANVIKPYAAKHGIEWVEVCRQDKDGNPVDLYDWLLKKEKSVPIPVRMSASGAPGRRTCTQDWKVKVITGELLRRIPKGVKRKATIAAALVAKEYLTELLLSKKMLSDSQKAELIALTFSAKADIYREDCPIVLGKGISTDEAHRARTKGTDPCYSQNYPLLDLGLSRDDCVKIIVDAGLPLAPKSSCWFCPFKTMDRWQEMRRLEPETFQRSVELERLLSDRASKLGRGSTYFTSRGTTKKAYLDELTSDQMTLFDDWSLDFCESGFCMT